MSLGGILGQSADLPENLVLAQKSGTDYTGVLTDLLGTVVPLTGAGYCKIETGSYVGKGNLNSGNPNSLSFSFKPNIVIVVGKPRATATLGDDEVAALFFFPDILTASFVDSSYYAFTLPQDGAPIAREVHAKFDDNLNMLSWYYSAAYGQKYQGSVSGKTYCWIAIGT